MPTLGLILVLLGLLVLLIVLAQNLRDGRRLKGLKGFRGLQDFRRPAGVSPEDQPLAPDRREPRLGSWAEPEDPIDPLGAVDPTGLESSILTPASVSDPVAPITEPEPDALPAASADPRFSLILALGRGNALERAQAVLSGVRRVGSKPARLVLDERGAATRFMVLLNSRSSGVFNLEDHQALSALLGRLAFESLDFANLQQQSREAARSLRELDAQLALQVLCSRPPSMALFEAAALAAGLLKAGEARFLASGQEGQTLFTVYSGSRTDLITMLLDLPVIQDPMSAYDRLLTVAQELCITLEGRIVDDNLQPISARQLEQTGAQIAHRAAILSQQGLAPGSPAARWVFA